MAEEKIPLVGIIGGVASGKSFVGQELQRLGAVVISADDLAHEVLRLDDVKRAIRAEFGDGVFDDDGQVDRARLAAIVFAPPPDGPVRRKTLEQLTHPRIGAMARQQVENIQRQRTAKAVILDVPLLTESGWHKQCDRIVFVEAPREVRQARAAERGWNQQDFERREAVQQSLEAKRALADVIIDNSGNSTATREAVQRVWPTLFGD